MEVREKKGRRTRYERRVKKSEDRKIREKGDRGKEKGTRKR